MLDNIYKASEQPRQNKGSKISNQILPFSVTTQSMFFNKWAMLTRQVNVEKKDIHRFFKVFCFFF